MSFDKIFSMMYRLNEGRFGVGGGNRFSAGNSERKIVAVAKTDFTFRIKLVGDWADYIVSGRLTKPGYDGIINFINTQAPKEFLKKYEDVNLKDKYFLVYEILKDREDALFLEDKQVFEFTITERSTVRNLSKDVNHVTMEELELIKSGSDPIQGKTELNTGVVSTSGVVGNTGVVSTTSGLTDTQIKAKTTAYIGANEIKGNTDEKVRAFILAAFKLVRTDPAGTTPGMDKVKSEIQAKKLDAATQAFVYALNAGFGVKDADLGEDIESGISAKLNAKIWANKIPESRGYFLHPNGYSLIKEEASAIIGFDSDAFIKGFALKIEQMRTKTGDITVPPEGFKFDNGATKNPELLKFQTILKTNLPIWKNGAAKNLQVVKDFNSTKNPIDGGYGTRTQNLIFWLKDGLSDPRYADTDRNTIKPDFVNRMLKEFNLIKESKSYQGLNSRGLISEDFDFDAAADSAGGSTVVTTKKVVTPKVDKDGKPVVYVKKEDKKSGTTSGYFQLQSNNIWEYAVKDGVWHYRKRGSKDALAMSTNINTIKELIKDNFSVAKDGYFINGYKDSGGFIKRSDDRLYQFDKATSTWQVKLNGAWQTVQNPASLVALYGTNPTVSGGSTSSSLAINYDSIYSGQLAIARKIKGWFDGASFNAYIGYVKDDWEGAYDHMTGSLWTGIVSDLNKYDAEIAKAIKLNDKDPKALILQSNQNRIKEIKSGNGKGSTNSLNFKQKMGNHDPRYTDSYAIELRNLSGGNTFVTVDCDIK
jgi:hypothetical protein